MKSVLISIRQKWCELIASGKKSIEVRKTRPRIATPFKCYIYETKGKTDVPTFVDEDGHCIYEGRGQIIGEFVCDEIRYADAFNFVVKEDGEKALEGSCIDKAELFEYLGWERGMPRAECTPYYRWHISELKIYDTPKKLTDFIRPKNCGNAYDCETCNSVHPCSTRPPQSWCYVEEYPCIERKEIEPYEVRE